MRFFTKEGKPEHWPMRYTIAHWATLLKDVAPGKYYVHSRSIDDKGNAQPIMKDVPKDPWSNDYVYVFPGARNAESFDLISYGSDGVQGGGNDVSNWKEASPQ